MSTNGKLWVYGDSYAASFDFLSPDIPVWTRKVAATLNLECNNKALSGSGLDHLMHTTITDAPLYSENDTCIFVLTQLARSWQISYDPTTSYVSDRRYDIDHHSKLRKTYLECWIHAIENYTSHLKLRPLIIPAWDPEISYRPKTIGWASGDLFNASLDEIIFPEGTKKEYPKSECRLNHLCMVNHNKLSDMIVNWFLNGTNVNCENLDKMTIPLDRFDDVDLSVIY